MPTPVTGNPTGVAAPAVLPGPDTFVIVNEPIAGEGATAASVNQAFTALANEQAWEKKPTAAAPASPTDAINAQPIKAYRNNRGRRQSFVDHRGRRGMERVSYWQEDWSNVALTAKTAASTGPWGGRWNFDIIGGVGGSPVLQTRIGPNYLASSDNGLRGGYLLMDSGGTASTIIEAEASPQSGVLITDDIDCILQTELGSFAGGGEYAFGMINSTLIGNSSSLASTGAVGWAILVRNGDTTLHLYLNPPSGSPTVTDLGSALNTKRVRVEMTGANQADDGNARITVYCDGTDVFSTAALFDPGPPDTTNLSAYWPFFRMVSNGGRIVPCFGVTEFSANRYGGDIAY